MELASQIIFVLAFAVQLNATYFALRLMRRTKYNSVWILFIIGFMLLTVTLVLAYMTANGSASMSGNIFVILGSVVSLCMSVGVMYAHKLFGYIERLNRRQELYNKRLLTAILRTEEKSRSRFAKELHDGTGPLLSAAKMSLTALKEEQRPDRRRQLTENTLTVIEEAIRSLREISNNMQPQLLNDFGLARGIRNFIDKSLTIRDDVKINFATNIRDERFDPEVEVILYRVVCELVNNSVKHSGCSSIDCSLIREGHTLILEYADDGCGFDPAEVAETGLGMGLSNIASRIDSLNGSFTLESSRGEGMTARAQVETGIPAI